MVDEDTRYEKPEPVRLEECDDDTLIALAASLLADPSELRRVVELPDKSYQFVPLSEEEIRQMQMMTGMPDPALKQSLVDEIMRRPALAEEQAELIARLLPDHKKH